MTFAKFWELLRRGGKESDLGITYKVVTDGGEEKLHIDSPNSKNRDYKIAKEKAEEYFKDPNDSNHSWFNKVHHHIVKTSQ